MPAPSREAVLKALADFIALGHNVGLAKVVHPLEQFHTEFQSIKPTLKVLQGPVNSTAGIAFGVIRDRVYDMAKDKPRPGMKKQDQELDRSFRALQEVVFPPAYCETEIVGLAGNRETTTVIGETKDAEKIAKQSLHVVQRFSKAVFRQDIETAYELCANELRAWMNVERFVSELNKADKRFGGSAVGLTIERITWIYGNAASRKRSNRDGDWPKETPKPNKRALVGAFWFTNKKQRRGRSAFFWVTEADEGYRIAKFSQYLQ